jgi:hypothetical protein
LRRGWSSSLKCAHVQRVLLEEAIALFGPRVKRTRCACLPPKMRLLLVPYRLGSTRDSFHAYGAFHRLPALFCCPFPPGFLLRFPREAKLTALSLSRLSQDPCGIQRAREWLEVMWSQALSANDAIEAGHARGHPGRRARTSSGSPRLLIAGGSSGPIVLIAGPLVGQDHAKRLEVQLLANASAARRWPRQLFLQSYDTPRLLATLDFESLRARI